MSFVKYIQIEINQNFTGSYNASLKRTQFDYLLQRNLFYNIFFFVG